MIEPHQLLIAALFTAQAVRIVVWTGLVVASVLMIVLMRTQWGQAQPLRKCIVLSMLVHLLFGVYTTTVNIVTAGRGIGYDDPMTVAIDDGEAGGTAEGTEESGGDRLGGSPWNTFGSSAAPQIDKGLIVPKLQDRPTKSDFKLPGPKDSTLEKIAGTSKRPVDDADSPGIDMNHVLPRHSASDAARIEVPKSSRPQERPPDVAPPEPTDRYPVDPPNIAISRGPSDLPRDPLESTAALSPPRVEDAQMLAPGPTGSQNTTQRPSSTGGDGDGPLVPIAAGAIRGSGDGGDAQSVPSVLQGRIGSDRLRRAIANGGSRDTEAAVTAALAWLAKNQDPDGRWNAFKLEAGREVMVNGHDRRGAGSKADTGITGLVLLSFLAHGNTHLKGEHPKTVQRGLEWLLSMQGADGNLGGNATVYERTYCHAMATCAISEAYAMSGDDRLENGVKHALAYCVAAQDRSGGGWRYQPGDPGDTSQLGWQVMALKSGELAGIEIPPSTRDGMVKFLKSVAQGRRNGLASYRPGHRVTHTMTAEALVCRQFLGMTRENPAAIEAAESLMDDLPGVSEDNVYYWYYGTLGMFQHQGEHWKAWNKALQEQLLNSQRTDGNLQGSWDPDKAWGAYGGRAYSTALSTLCLEVYYRFLPLYVEAARRER